MGQAHFRSRAFAGFAGVAAAFELYLIGVWAAAGGGYFWPVWPLLAMAPAARVWAARRVAVLAAEAELAERIDTLESTRAGAVDEQESELRRIERDLHDGAQARLVALGMSLGMAEHTLAEDPQRAGELLAEARVGAEEALSELRDLARGIHPPVLSDRGLEAAIAALASSTPMPVTVSVDAPRQTPPGGRDRRLLRRRRGARQRGQVRQRAAVSRSRSAGPASSSSSRSATTAAGAPTPRVEDCAGCAGEWRRSTDTWP